MLRREITNPRNVSCRFHDMRHIASFDFCEADAVRTSGSVCPFFPKALATVSSKLVAQVYFIKSGFSPVEHLAWILLYPWSTKSITNSEKCLGPRTSKDNVQRSGSRNVSNTKLSRGPVCLVAREIN